MKVAGIVLYNPDIERLRENIDAVKNQVDHLIFINNHSANYSQVKQICDKVNNSTFIDNKKNLGVAYALNQIAKRAQNLGAEWVLTLDQDSVCLPGIVSEYEKYTQSGAASLTCYMKDRNFDIDNLADLEISEVDFCITSGNYINLSIWKKLHGFDSRLFIDKIDTDYCYRLITNGYSILKIPYVGILHEVGTNTQRHKFLGKSFVVFNHSPFRCYYLIRNQIYFGRKHEKTMGKKNSLRYRLTAWTRIFI